MVRDPVLVVVVVVAAVQRERENVRGRDLRIVFRSEMEGGLPLAMTMTAGIKLMEVAGGRVAHQGEYGERKSFDSITYPFPSIGGGGFFNE